MENERFQEVKNEAVENAKELFADMTIDQIDELYKAVRSAATETKKEIRAKIRAEEKAKKEAEREALSAENSEKLDNVVEGTEVTVLVGSGKNVEEVTGSFVKKTEKRFTVLVDGVKKSVMFHRLISIAEPEEITSEDFIDDEISADDVDSMAL